MKPASNSPHLKAAQEGDLVAFQSLFVAFQDQLKSYLYRLLASRADAEDIAHDTFIRAFDNLDTFEGKSSLKTWVFQIATRLTYNYLQKRNRWVEDVKTQSKKRVMDTPALAQSIQQTREQSPFGQFEIREHISTCFTCMGKTLPIDQQIALILKDIYAFSVKEIMLILGQSEGTVKYALQKGRGTLTDIFQRRCALVNKQGVCHQCSELNGWLNPKQDQQQALMQVKLTQKANSENQEALYQLRTQLVRAIDPLRSEGNELQEILLDCNRMVMGEIPSPG